MDENASAFEVVVNDQIIPLELPASVDPLDAVRFEILLNFSIHQPRWNNF